MASQGPTDPVSALTYALSLPTDSPDQAHALKTLRHIFEAQPAAIPQFCTTLLQNAVAGKDSLFKRFVIELFCFALGTAGLSLDARTQLASDCLELAATLLASADNAHILKLVIQCFCHIYPLLFRVMCTSRTANRQPWDILSISKRRILDFVDNPATGAGTAPSNSAGQGNARLGVRIAALKFVQRLILVQTRLVQDPRLQNRADPNLSLCPSNHPFIDSAALENEGRTLLTQLMAILYTSSNSDIICAIINSFSALAKLRPSLVHPLVEALIRWEPRALAAESVIRIKSVEKAAYIFLNHLLRSNIAQQFAGDITRALDAISERLRHLARVEQMRRVEAAAKRPLSSGEAGPSDMKRARLDPASNLGEVGGNSAGQLGGLGALGAAGAGGLTPAALAGFDWHTMSRDKVTDLIVANLQHFSEEAIQQAIAAYRVKKGILGDAPPPAAGSSTSPDGLDDEEMEYEPDKLNMQLERTTPDEASAPSTQNALDSDDELALQLGPSTYELPPPKPLDTAQTSAFLRATMVRLAAQGGSLVSASSSSSAREGEGTMIAKGPPPSEMWVLLLVRMITRAQANSEGAPPALEGDAKAKKEDQDSSMVSSSTTTVDVKGKGRSVDEVWERNEQLRGTILDYVLSDFAGRTRIATLWMNEEWYNSSSRGGDIATQNEYTVWLGRILDGYRSRIDASDRALTPFLLDLPYLPPSVFDLLAGLCVNQTTTTTGLDALRDLVTLRPPVRAQALRIILDLTTSPETVLRIAAIKAVKRWVPGVHPMDELSRTFAVNLLRRLETASSTAATNGDAEMQDGEEVNSKSPSPKEEGETAPQAPLTTPYLPATIELPARPAQVLQHVQLIFALCVKSPELLEEIFDAYSRMEESVQNAVQDHLAPVIRSIGGATGTPAYQKLLSLVRVFRPGAESLALRVIRILTDHTGRPAAPVVALVKGLISERDLDARFLIPIIAELDKAEITRQIPRIVSMLGNNIPGTTPAEQKALVKSVFMAVLEKPEHGFGKVSTNLPRLRESQLLEPVKLLVLLHEASDINVASAREAIDICFGLTDLFPSEILAAAIQQLVDNATLPVLFMRTVIQAVKTYKTLIPYVAGGLMTRLIQKKIWTLGSLWNGFVLCGKIIAPASYASLLLLPSAQLAEVAEKHPALRTGLREYVLKKGGNTSRYLDVLGREESQPAPAPVQQPVVG